ncbi:unnamed protein product [Chrysoparadoxa australica]
MVEKPGQHSSNQEQGVFHLGEPLHQQQQQPEQAVGPEVDDDYPAEVAYGETKEGQTPDRAWRMNLQVGDELDVKDTVNKFCEAEVLEIDKMRGLVRITYTYWGDSYDETIPIDSDRLAPFGSETYQGPHGIPLKVGDRVDYSGEQSVTGRVRSEVMEISQGRVRLKVYMPGRNIEVVVPLNSPDIHPYGREKKLVRKSHRLAGLGHAHKRQIAIASSKYQQYVDSLRRHGLAISRVEGDGNCLFRSISHQIYGTDAHHELVRSKCMDYMESEVSHQSSVICLLATDPYVEGGMPEFLQYVATKRQNAVWGDDPEVQALCELYNRPAEIWAYDKAQGAKTLRTFHEMAATQGAATSGSSRMTPMRLSYYGGGHYDSIVTTTTTTSSSSCGSGTGAEAAAAAAAGIASEAVALELVPGQVEDEAIACSKQRVAMAAGGSWGEMKQAEIRSDHEATDDAFISLALQASREEFDAQFADLDSTLVAGLEEAEEKAAVKDSELIAVQDQMLRSVQEQSEQDELRQALEASRQQQQTQQDLGDGLAFDPAAAELKAVMKESLRAQQQEQASEEMQLQRALALSQQAAADSCMDYEDPELAAALAASLETGGMAAAAGKDGDYYNEEMQKAIDASLSWRNHGPS